VPTMVLIVYREYDGDEVGLDDGEYELFEDGI
jgi:hypothetical protein